MSESVKILIEALENIASDTENCECESFKTAISALVDYKNDVYQTKKNDDKFSVTTYQPKNVANDDAEAGADKCSHWWQYANTAGGIWICAKCKKMRKEA